MCAWEWEVLNAYKVSASSAPCQRPSGCGTIWWMTTEKSYYYCLSERLLTWFNFANKWTKNRQWNKSRHAYACNIRNAGRDYIGYEWPCEQCNAQRECLCVIRSYPAVSLWVQGACGLLEESICSLKCLVFSCQLPETKLRLLSGEGLTNHREKTVLTCTCRSRMKHVLFEKKMLSRVLLTKGVLYVFI